MRKALVAVVVAVAAGGVAYSSAQSVTVEALGPRAAAVSWAADGNETSFTHERAATSRGSYRQRHSEIVATLFGPVRRFEDTTAEPARGYVYRVSSTDESGATSVSGEAYVETPPTLGLRVRRGEVRQGPGGSVALRGSVRFLRSAASREFDPATQSVELQIGDAASLAIPAGDPRWILRRGAHVWSGNVGDTGAQILVLDFVRNRIEYTRDLDFQQTDGGYSTAHVVLRIGGDGVEKYLPLRDRGGARVFSSRR